MIQTTNRCTFRSTSFESSKAVAETFTSGDDTRILSNCTSEYAWSYRAKYFLHFHGRTQKIRFSHRVKSMTMMLAPSRQGLRKAHHQQQNPVRVPEVEVYEITFSAAATSGISRRPRQHGRVPPEYQESIMHTSLQDERYIARNSVFLCEPSFGRS